MHGVIAFIVTSNGVVGVPGVEGKQDVFQCFCASNSKLCVPDTRKNACSHPPPVSCTKSKLCTKVHWQGYVSSTHCRERPCVRRVSQAAAERERNKKRWADDYRRPVDCHRWHTWSTATRSSCSARCRACS